MPKDLRDERLAAWLAGELSEEESRELEKQAGEDPELKESLRKSQEVWALMEGESQREFRSPEAAWNDLEVRLEEEKSGGAKVRRLLPLWLSAAAAVFILAGLGLWWWDAGDAPRWEMISTAVGVQQKIDLPDGSRVWLNENSELSFEEAFPQRTVKLRGEAFFEVEPDAERPFSILAEGTQTVVLGTAFNVRAYPEEKEVEVTVQEGQVRFEAPEQTTRAVLLEKGDQGLYAGGEIRRDAGSGNNALAWRTHRLSFADARLLEVLDALRRYYEIEIEVSDPALLNCRFTGGPFEEPELEELLRVIEFSTELQFEKKGDRSFVLTGRPCGAE